MRSLMSGIFVIWKLDLQKFWLISSCTRQYFIWIMTAMVYLNFIRGCLVWILSTSRLRLWFDQSQIMVISDWEFFIAIWRKKWYHSHRSFEIHSVSFQKSKNQKAHMIILRYKLILNVIYGCPHSHGLALVMMKNLHFIYEFFD